MSTVKQRYDAVRPRERVNFGGFQFVIPSPNFQMPKFQCCNGAHEGVAEPEHETDSFDLSECVKEVPKHCRCHVFYTYSTKDSKCDKYGLHAIHKSSFYGSKSDTICGFR
ncbi:hypothetical protein OSTOST_19925, partial [Ostertagia ostertagi]